MAMVPLSGSFMWPKPLSSVDIPQFAGIDMWSGGPTKLAYIFRAPKTGTLEKFGFRPFSIPTPRDIKVSWQNISSTTPDPDGTVDQFRVIPQASVVAGWVESGIISSDGTDGGVKRSVTQGDVICAVLEFDSTAGDVSQYIWTTHGQGTSQAVQYPGVLLRRYVGGTWYGFQNITTIAGVVVVKYTDGYVNLTSQQICPGLNSTDLSLSTSTTPDEIGIKFDVFAPMTVSGAWLHINLLANADVILYDTDGTTILASDSLVALNRGITTIQMLYIRFSSNIDLPIGTGYRLVVKPTTTTSVQIRDLSVSVAAHLDALDGGQAMQYTARTDAGAWAETTTRRPWMGLIVTGVSDGAGGGGGGGTGDIWPIVNRQVAVSGASIASLAAPAMATTTGHQIVVGISFQGAATVTVTDTAGNTYAQVGTEATEGGNRERLYRAYNITGNAANIVTVSFSVNSSFTSLQVIEMEMDGTSDPVLGTASANGSGTTITSGSVAASGPAALIAQVVGNGTTIRPTNGMILLNWTTNVSTNNEYLAAGIKLISAAESVVMSQASASWAITAASFKVPAAASGGGGTTVLASNYGFVG